VPVPGILRGEARPGQAGKRHMMRWQTAAACQPDDHS